MKRKILSILAVLALCLTMLPVAAFATDPFAKYDEGDTIELDGKMYKYLGDATETGLALGEWEVELYGPAGIAKAGEGYVSYYVEDSVAYITVNNATISAMSEDVFEGYGILVVDYDAHINGIGTNVIDAANTAVDVSGCLTMTGEFQRVAGMLNGIACYQSWGFGEEDVSVEGGDLMINANIGEVIGTDAVAIHSDGSLIINGNLGDVSGGTAISTGSGLTSDNVKEGSLTINGDIGSIVGYMNAGISGRGHVTIGKDAVIGEIVADTIGIYVDCITDDNWVPVTKSSLTILGKVGPISASQIQEEEGAENWVRYGITVTGGDVVIAKGASVESIYGTDYGVSVEGGRFIQNGAVPGGITGGEEDLYVEEWPSMWAYEEVAEAVDKGLVPEELLCKFTQATTRAEYCALATCLYETVTGETIELTEEDMNVFADVKDDENIAKMYKIGVVNGVGENRFAPNNILTREQAATMLSRLAYAVGEPLEAADPAFADNDKIFDYAYEAVGQVQAAGIMQGKENNLFDPKGSYTREQSILTMNRLFDLV